jgi:DNA-binding response OmpR family regulator
MTLKNSLKSLTYVIFVSLAHLLLNFEVNKTEPIVRLIKEMEMDEVPKILVVDDEIGICRNVEKILTKNNYEVVHAQSAKEALGKMAKQTFSLLLSDIVMPEMDGIELLKLAKEQWPLTKVMMMTAYASTDTAMKAIRLGAEDYVPKPFTPDGLRDKVDSILVAKSKTSIGTENKIDVDIPFDRDEVARYANGEYAKMLGPSDMPGVGRSLENYCSLGEMVCDIFKKLNNTCKGGIKTGECPQKKAKAKKDAKKKAGFDGKKLIGIDQPFNYEEVISVTGTEYVKNLQYDGISFLPYEDLKKNVARMMDQDKGETSVTHEVMEEPATKNILVIDDEVAVNNNIRKILVKKGYHVDQAITKSEAIEKIDERAYKLILLDLRIPGVRGLELLELIREKRPDAKVIIVTGYANIETAVETARLGAIDFLAKPFTPNEIRSATEKAFQLAA